MPRQVLVTGGTSSIGRAIAEAFAAEGCRVVVTGRTEDEVDKAIELAENVRAQVLDVAQSEQIAAVVGALDGLDVLVNAAGMILRDGLEFDIENFARVVDVNLNGTMRVCSAA